MRLSDDTQRLVAPFKTPAAGLCCVDDTAMSDARCPGAPGGGSRAKRTVGEGSEGRLIPFGRSRVLDIDAQRCRHGPLLLLGSHPRGGNPQSFYPPSNTTPPFALSTLLHYLPCLSLYPHIIPGNHHILFCCLWSLYHVVPPRSSTSSRIVTRTQSLGIIDGAHCSPNVVRSSHNMLCCASPTEAGRRLWPCG
jgi:hypothetical protein